MCFDFSQLKWQQVALFKEEVPFCISHLEFMHEKPSCVLISSVIFKEKAQHQIKLL